MPDNAFFRSIFAIFTTCKLVVQKRYLAKANRFNVQHTPFIKHFCTTKKGSRSLWERLPVVCGFTLRSCALYLTAEITFWDF